LNKEENKKNISKDHEVPFSNFVFGKFSNFNVEDEKMSLILMTYFSNFIKNG
jgi:hypothetical protein